MYLREDQGRNTIKTHVLEESGPHLQTLLPTAHPTMKTIARTYVFH